MKNEIGPKPLPRAATASIAALTFGASLTCTALAPAAPAAPTASVAATQPADDAAMAAFRAEDFKRARDLFIARTAKNPADVAAWHGQGLCGLRLRDVKAARAAFDKAMAAASRPDRALVYNSAATMCEDGDANAAARAIRDYLFAHPTPLDEPLLNALGTSLQRGTTGDQKVRADCQRFYATYNAQLEQACPGMRRWGEEWVDAAEADAREQKVKDLGDQLASANQELGLVRQRVEQFRGELARTRAQGNGIRSGKDMESKLAHEEDDLKSKQVAASGLTRELAGARPRFADALMPIGMDERDAPKLKPLQLANATPAPAAVPSPPAAEAQAPAAVAATPPADAAPTPPTAGVARPTVASAGASSGAPTPPGRVAPDDGMSGHAYCVIDEPADFDKAKAACKTLGGQLLVVESEAENRFVVEYLKSSGHGRSFQAWIGLSSTRAPIWQWVNGRPVTFRGWAAGEPNDRGKLAVCFWCNDQGAIGWADDPMIQRIAYICEWPNRNAVPGGIENVAVADAAAIASTKAPAAATPREITIDGKAGPDSRAASLGRLRRGETLFLQYVRGEWSAFPRDGIGSPDAVPRGKNVLAASLAEVTRGSVVHLLDVPAATADEPFAFVADRDCGELVLNMNDPSPNNNTGAVVYRYWIEPASKAK